MNANTMFQIFNANETAIMVCETAHAAGRAIVRHPGTYAWKSDDMPFTSREEADFAAGKDEAFAEAFASVAGEVRVFP